MHKVLDNKELMLTILAHLDLEDLCRVALVRRSWRKHTDSPEFWSTISLRGRTLQVAKVVHLLRRHSCVQQLDARGVRLSPADLADVLPVLTALRSLELDKPGYDDRELAAISDHLPVLTRLVLAGGAVGSPGHMFHHHVHAAGAAAGWPTLRHPVLECLALECGRAPRLRLALPRLARLELRDFNCGSLQLAEGGALESLSLADCGKMSDSALRFLLCLEGEASQPRLPRLTTLSLSGVAHVGDETLRSCGQRHAGLTRLVLAGCPALTGEALARAGGFASLQELILDACDCLCG